MERTPSNGAIEDMKIQVASWVLGGLSHDVVQISREKHSYLPTSPVCLTRIRAPQPEPASSTVIRTLQYLRLIYAWQHLTSHELLVCRFCELKSALRRIIHDAHGDLVALPAQLDASVAEAWRLGGGRHVDEGREVSRDLADSVVSCRLEDGPTDECVNRRVGVLESLRVAIDDVDCGVGAALRPYDRACEEGTEGE